MKYGVLARVAPVILAAMALALGPAPLASADPATPDEWGMDDGRGVGPRVAGTPCLAAEAHSWADSTTGGGIALWCPPPAFVWVPVR
jgi:hypothetical protein